MKTRAKEDLLETCDYVWNRLRTRLGGLTDDEYLWEPVPGCFTIRRSEDGSWTWDHVWPPPDPPPVTTIAWRLTHIAADRSTGHGGTDNRLRSWLGLPAAQAPPHDVPSTAQQALDAVDHARTLTRDALSEMTEDSLWEPIGPIGGMYKDATRVALVLHHMDELIHHSAEIGLLRDLYRVRDQLGR